MGKPAQVAIGGRPSRLQWAVYRWARAGSAAGGPASTKTLLARYRYRATPFTHGNEEGFPRNIAKARADAGATAAANNAAISPQATPQPVADRRRISPFAARLDDIAESSQ